MLLFFYQLVWSEDKEFIDSDDYAQLLKKRLITSIPFTMDREILINMFLLLLTISLVLVLLYFRKKIGFLILEILFNNGEAKIILLAFNEGKKTQKYWLINQVGIPILILYIPYFFTLINRHFETIIFSKSISELTLTGALTIMGINVMRTNLTLVDEKLENNLLAEQAWFREIISDNESLKSKLKTWIWILTFIGSILYVTLVCGFILPNKPKSIYYIVLVIIAFIASAILGRILSVVQQNFAKDDQKVQTHFAIENKKGKEEYENLKDQAKDGGLL